MTLPSSSLKMLPWAGHVTVRTEPAILMTPLSSPAP